MKIDLQPAFVLHTYTYRETSFIAELFTKDYGRVPMVAQGARSRKTWQGLLQPFVPVLVSWSGKGELMSLKDIEANGMPYWLSERKLLSSFYLNELLMRLLHRHDPHPQLFDYYAQVISQLTQVLNEEYALRQFEKQLLDELGYGLVWQREAISGEPIDPHRFYRYEALQGLVQVPPSSAGNSFAGKTILALANDNLTATELAPAKRLMRLALGELLGDKPLKTRELFSSAHIPKTLGNAIF